MKLLLYIICVLAGCLKLAAADSAKPNIVFLLADDVNRDTWGIYGSLDCQTPHIDQLAKDGLTFNQVFCSTAMCAPFRQELYSGRHPWRTGTLANHSKSKPETKSWPHYLKPLGYRTALVGKSHVGPKVCYPFENLKLTNGKSGDMNPAFVKSTELFLDECQQTDQPFCLVIASHDGHAPFTTGDPSVYVANELTIPPYWLDTPELRETLVKYYAEITNFDALVGQVRELLERRRLWDHTVFIVCSEQGGQLPFAKWTCYANGLQTGVVMHWPELAKAGASIDQLVSIADIAPTLVDIVGGEYSKDDFDGKSFLPLLRGDARPIHDFVYGAFTNCNIIDNRERIFPIRVIRNQEFSLIYNPNYEGGITSNITLSGVVAKTHPLKFVKANSGSPATSWYPLRNQNERAKNIVYKLNHRPEFELYHLTNDPYELRNVVSNPEYQLVLAKLKQNLMTRLVEFGDADPIATEKSLVRGNAKKKK